MMRRLYEAAMELAFSPFRVPRWVQSAGACCAHPSDVHLPGGGCSECPIEEYDHDYWDGLFRG